MALKGYWNAGMGEEVGDQFEWLDSWVWKLLTGRYLEYWIWLGAHLSADSYLSSFLSQGRWERGTQILHRPFVLLWSLEGEDASGHQGYHEREEKAQGEGRGSSVLHISGHDCGGDKKGEGLCEVIILSGCLLGCQVKHLKNVSTPSTTKMKV